MKSWLQHNVCFCGLESVIVIEVSCLVLSIIVPSLCLQISSWHSLCINSFFILLLLKLSEESTVRDVYYCLGSKCCQFMLHSLLGFLLETEVEVSLIFKF